MRGRAALLVVGTALVLPACSGGSNDSGDSAAATTITQVRGGSDSATPVAGVCALATVDMVRTIFGGPVASTSDSGRCRFDVPDGFVRLWLQESGDTVSTIAPYGTAVEGLGRTALWVASVDGGLLAVETGDGILVFDTQMEGLELETTQARLVGFARLVIDKFDRTGVEIPVTVPEPGPGPACTLVSEDLVADALGLDSSGVTVDDRTETCIFGAGPGRSLSVGPITPSATTADLAGIQMSTTLNGVEQPWERTELDIADGAVLLADPTSPNTVELWVLHNGDLIHLAMSGSVADGGSEPLVRVATDIANR